MRHFLLATTALLSFAGAAQAAEAPIQVTLGGSVDFRAALFHESEKVMAFGETGRRGGDFQSVFEVSLAAEGKGAKGITYGAFVLLDNNPALIGSENDVAMDQVYVWMSSAYGKIILGDEHGTSDLFVMAPTVGEGQIDGTYTNFTDATTLSEFQPTYLSGTENSTKVTYYTPKIGTTLQKVQAGISFTSEEAQGTAASLYESTTATGYKNQVEGTIQYTGTFNPVSVVVSPMLATGEGKGTKTTTSYFRDYTAWGVGAQALYAGFTLGTSYVDAGHKGTALGQDLDQDVWTLGLGYEIDKVALAANYMNGEGYDNGLTGADSPYINSFNAFGLGATYTWLPGLTTAADAVFFDQERKEATSDNEGHVLILTQKMSF